ncbi:MAG: ribosome biogenesis GTP-binding protein YihA/YsxC [Pseudomonadales bacterium]
MTNDASRPDDRLEVAFLTSAPDLERSPPPDQPEVAFAGRSNAGKSSVLNRLTGSRQTAKVSKTPGRTQMLNFFQVNRIGRDPSRGRIIDLPGYGYAKAGRDAQARWQQEVNRFLSERQSLVAMVLVMDIRHPLQPYDLEMIDWAAASALPLLVLLNKADKIGYGAQQKVLAQVRTHLRELPDADAVTFSALKGGSSGPLLEALRGWLVDVDLDAFIDANEPSQPDGPEEPGG